MAPGLLQTYDDSDHHVLINGANGVNGVTKSNGGANGVISKKHPVHLDGFGTRAIHIGSDPNPETGAVIPSISLSTTYKQDSIGVHKGFEYSRSGNPNRNALEATLAAIEYGGAHALAFSSGSATTATVLQSLGPNAHVLSVNDVYGGTFRYMRRVAAENQGLQTTFLDLENADEDTIISAIKDNTKLIWIETPTNPTLRVIDIAHIVSLAHSHPSKPLVLVDNTFMSPFYSSPLLLGADIVLHSLTKYVNGHSDVVMGALILPSHHSSLHSHLRFLQNAIGAVPSPYDCWLAQRGAKTLHLRMKAHGTNALAVAHALESSPHVEQVIYPGLSTHPRHKRAYASLSPHARKFADAYMRADSEKTGDFPYGGMISFRIRGGRREAEKFLTSTRLFALAESLGGVESLAEHPALMTHGSIPPAEREHLGIGDNLIRLSVGLEEVEDLVNDVEQALEEAALVGEIPSSDEE
ncbi:Cys/Met metabolism PLP-dependent enzyme domain containing protein [Amanita muscaria]